MKASDKIEVAIMVKYIGNKYINVIENIELQMCINGQVGHNKQMQINNSKLLDILKDNKIKKIFNDYTIVMPILNQNNIIINNFTCIACLSRIVGIKPTPTIDSTKEILNQYNEITKVIDKNFTKLNIATDMEKTLSLCNTINKSYYDVSGIVNHH